MSPCRTSLAGIHSNCFAQERTWILQGDRLFASASTTLLAQAVRSGVLFRTGSRVPEPTVGFELVRCDGWDAISRLENGALNIKAVGSSLVIVELQEFDIGLEGLGPTGNLSFATG